MVCPTTALHDQILWFDAFHGEDFNVFFAISVIGLFVTLFDFLFHLGCSLSNMMSLSENYVDNDCSDHCTSDLATQWPK